MDDFRVIFVNAYSDVARVVMCEVGVMANCSLI